MSGSNITEKFEYLTDVITSYDGHEQRLKLRQYPRHFVSYDYPSMDCFQAQWLRGMGRIRQSDTYYIPMWHNPVYLSESHIAGRALYILPECMLSLENCEWIEIFVKDDVNQQGVNKICKVRKYTDSVIGLQNPIDEFLYTKNTFIYPLRKCSVQPVSNLQYIYSNGTNITHNFEDLLDVPSDMPIPDKYISEYEDYKQRNRWKLPELLDGRQVLTISPTWVDDNSVSLSIDKAVNKLDNYTGLFKYDLRNTKTYDIHTLEISLIYKQAINNMIRFFKRVCGKYKSFYAPTWVNDIQISHNIIVGTNYVYTKWNLIYQFYLSNRRNKKLVIFTKDWKSYILDILTYSYEDIENVRYGKIMFTKPITFNLPVSNILMASYMNLVRLDSDELQLNYESNNVANTTLVMREVDDD